MSVAFRQLMLMEWRIQRRRPVVWFCLVAFFSLAFSDTARSGWQGQGNAWINGAAMITNRAIIYGLLGVFAVAAIISDPMVRDRIYRVEPFVLSTPVTRFTLAMSRFLVAFLLVIAATAMFIPGMILGTQTRGIPPELVGPLTLSHYAKALAYFLIPNFLLVAALVFTVSSRWQNWTVAFGSTIGLVAFWVTFRMMLGRDVFQHDVFSTYALLDPFGTIASSEFMMGRTVAQNNVQFPPLQGLLLYNRLIWGAVACALLAIGTVLTPLRPRLPRAKTVKLQRSFWRPVRVTASSRAADYASPSANLRRPGAELAVMTVWELKNIWRQPGSKICMVFVAMTLWWSAGSVGTQLFSLPSTDLLIHTTSYYFSKVLVLVIVWTAGELTWRDRSLAVSELVDVLPTRDTTRFLSKTIALMFVVLAFWILSICVNIAYQAAHGYYRFEPWLYFTDSFIFKMPYYLWLAVLALAIQSVVRHRYIAMGLLLLVYVSETLFDALHWYHPLFRWGRVSHFWYSLMDGYGHFWRAHVWMLLYWSLGAFVVWLLGWASVWRGDHPPPRRWHWQRRLRTRRGASALAISVLLFIASGGFIWHQSTAKAVWPPRDDDLIKANIERVYAADWRNKPQPRVVSIDGEIDLYPSRRSFQIRGEYVLENHTESPIGELLVLATPSISLDRVELGLGAELLEHDHVLGVQQWRLGSPLQPDQRMVMAFQTSNSPPSGFAVHAEHDNIPEVLPVEVVGNGTSMLNLEIMPVIGYTDRVEHKPTWKRRRYGLPEQWQAPSGPSAERQGHATLHLGWIESMDMIVRTDADQTALHAGVLVKQWTEPDGREAFQYRMDRKARGWSAVLSGRYAVRTFHRTGLPDVVVHYDRQHESNVDFIANELHSAMEYFASVYGPPPFETFKLGEQSLHYDGMGARGGLAFNSEIRGWKADLSAGGDQDIRRMAALMMGLSWWGDQVIPANVAGAKVIHAGLPFWTASLFLHKTNNRATDRRLRSQALLEMFRSRGAMTDQETPFAAEFKDSTMIRNKGSALIIYLANLVGIETMESILAEFLDQCRYRDAPYPTAREFLELVKSRIPEELHPQVTDIFERITVWRLSVLDASCTPLDNGRWMVSATVNARKYYVAGWGDETEAEFDTPVLLSAFDGYEFSPESEIWSKTRRLASGENKIEIELDRRPTRFAVDPYLYLADPNPHDNALTVTEP